MLNPHLCQRTPAGITAHPKLLTIDRANCHAYRFHRILKKQISIFKDLSKLWQSYL